IRGLNCSSPGSKKSQVCSSSMTWVSASMYPMTAGHSSSLSPWRRRFRRVTIHPRLSVDSSSSYRLSLRDDIALWRQLGVGHVGLIRPKIEEAGWATARELVAHERLRISTVFGATYRPLDADRAHGWREADQQATRESLEFAAA